MIDTLFKIIGLISELIQGVAKASPMFLICIPLFLVGGESTGIIMMVMLGWMLLGGDKEKLKEQLRTIEGTTEIDAVVEEKPKVTVKKTRK
jgi:hypothetical protein